MLSKNSFSILRRICVTAGYGAILSIPFGGLAQAAGPPCNLATYKGVYSLIVTGAIIDEPSVPVPPGPVSRVGRSVADGFGNVAFEQRGSYYGVPSNENATGTYTVSPNCVITFIINAPPPVSFPVTFQGEILASGDYLTIMQINPEGTTVKVNAKRVQNVCAVEDLKGSYMLDLHGYIPPFTLLHFPPPFPPVIPIGNDAIKGEYQELGVLTFDPPRGNDLVAGKPGNLTADTTASYNGAIDHQLWTGTYTIDRECRVTASFSKHAGAAGVLDFTWWGVLADQGRDLRIVQEPLTLGPMDGDAYLSSK